MVAESAGLNWPLARRFGKCPTGERSLAAVRRCVLLCAGAIALRKGGDASVFMDYRSEAAADQAAAGITGVEMGGVIIRAINVSRPGELMDVDGCDGHRSLT